jgi:enoyl-CoA hydratase
MSYETLIVEREGGIARVVLNRPKVLNALNRQLIGELAQVLDALRGDANVRVVILTGAGEKAFAAGADINELAALSPVEAVDYARRGQRVFRDLETLGKPVIAAVNGFALGGGCELAMSCTLRIAAESARFGQPEVNLGIIPGYGGTQRLTRLVGKGRALDLVLTGRMVGAAEALTLGLVNQVVPDQGLSEAVARLAGTLMEKGPLALRFAMQAVHAGLEMGLDDALETEAHLFGLTVVTEDMKEGTAAFLEKRKPAFRGK